MHGLNDIRVIDFTTGITGPYTSKLFADGGADVIKVEKPEGDPMRQWSSTHNGEPTQAGDSAFFRYLHGGKRAVLGSPGDDSIKELIRGADLVIEDFAADSDEHRQLHGTGLSDSLSHLVVLSITPFGKSGPYATRAASEFTVQAECGSILSRGLPDETPYTAGGQIADYVGAAYAGVAALAAVRKARASDQGEHIDFSRCEAMQLASTIYTDLLFSMLGRPELPGPVRSVEVPSIEPCADGWVGFTTNSYQQLCDFLCLIERPDLLADEELATVTGRQARMEEWNEAVHAWTQTQQSSDIIEAAGLLRIPVASVNTGESVTHQEQFVARQVFHQHPDGDFLQPRPPYLLNGKTLTPMRPAPKLGEHREQIEAKARRTTKAGDDAHELPLQGIRILDATSWWAGPAATQILATLGADVIHLESIQRLDGARSVVSIPGVDPWWEFSQIHNGTNTNKRSLTLNLNDEQGIELMHKLIAQCDVLVENYSPRVFENFKLDRDTVMSINPEIIFTRMPAFGLDGPWRDRVGFAQTMEQMSGLAWVTGHTDDQPRIQRGPCDPIAGMHAAFAILVALAEREHTSNGQFLECAMVEAALNVAAEQVVEFSAYGKLLHREGNRSPYAAPQGVYACVGEENWLALSICNDAQWQTLLGLINDAALSANSALQTHIGRRAAQDEIDSAITGWAKQQDIDTVLETLLELDIPAAKLQFGGASGLHPQMLQRQFFESVTHPVIGTHTHPGMPFRFASRGAEPWIRCAAPTLGQHNREVLQDLLGLSEEDVQQLERQAVIGTVPVS